MQKTNATIKISIIVPMYNVGPFIEECLQSLWKQDLDEEEYEVVIVNDGSTDDSLAIAQELGSRHTNVQIISQKNKGLSMARNTGMETAKGDCIWFVDADDWIAPNCLKKISRQMEGLDVLAIAANNISETGVSLFSYPDTAPVPGCRFMEKWQDKVKVCAPFYIFRKSFLQDNQISFFPGIFHEDNEFTPRAITLARRIAACPYPCYQRRIRSGSITSTVNPRRPLDIIIGMKSLNRFSLAYSGKTRTALDTFIANTINFACKLSSRTDKASQGQFEESLRSEPWIRGVLLNASKPKFILEGILLSIFPGQLFRIHEGLMLFNPNR